MHIKSPCPFPLQLLNQLLPHTFQVDGLGGKQVASLEVEPQGSCRLDTAEQRHDAPQLGQELGLEAP